MTRLNRNAAAVPLLRKYRMNAGYTAREYARKIGIAYTSVLNVENGDEVSRMLATKYLTPLGFSLNKPEELPEGVRIIDVGEAVRLLSNQ